MTMLLSSSDADFHMCIVLSILNTYIDVTEHQVDPSAVSPVNQLKAILKSFVFRSYASDLCDL